MCVCCVYTWFIKNCKLEKDWIIQFSLRIFSEFSKLRTKFNFNDTCFKNFVRVSIEMGRNGVEVSVTQGKNSRLNSRKQFVVI